LVALNKKDGQKKWELPLDSYAWSSPVAVYGENGKGYVVLGEQSGRLHLVDGLTGDVLDTVRFTQKDKEGNDIGQTIEATPAIFGNMIVVGTRANRIYGVRIK
jgi:outer membrane protein assembly factor BamB